MKSDSFRVISPSTTRDNDKMGGVGDFRCPANWQTIMTGYVDGISDALKASDEPYKTTIF